MSTEGLAPASSAGRSAATKRSAWAAHLCPAPCLQSLDSWKSLCGPCHISERSPQGGGSVGTGQASRRSSLPAPQHEDASINRDITRGGSNSGLGLRTDHSRGPQWAKAKPMRLLRRSNSV
uniref:Uncharacterized protein n=1 Tax=Rousettus aegyptiacus TaxID=9407 RepID=A0A7J8BE46_ROUAE|nr:hypothetical protein HJG63_009677 [Rousettus aegyptiacus]